MDPKYYGLVEVVFTAAIVFGLGFWQLWSLRGGRGGDRRAETSLPPASRPMAPPAVTTAVPMGPVPAPIDAELPVELPPITGS